MTPIKKSLESSRETLRKAHEEIAGELAWAIQQELKSDATDYKRERLAEAIEDFLR